MSFTEFRFLIFFAAVYVLLWGAKLFVGKKSCFVTVNKLLLLAASYALTAIVDPKFCLSLTLVIFAVYFLALGMHRNKKYRGILLFAGVFVVLLQLGFFKYYNFFASSISSLLDIDFIAVKLIAPLGISFYSFSAIGYLVDVYREKYEANKSFLDVALYISFFTKLVSGPIVKPAKFFSQLDAEHTVNLKRLEKGIQIVVLGMFKKMVLADNLSVFVNDVFGAPSAFDGLTVLLAMISYSMQIYFDFSGYSDIAIGFSHMLGFDFDKNFDLPYVSQNPTEFWKRWHISLSQWLQEYLYISLGGNRKGKFRTNLNLFLTMLIGGLWHGASFTFVAWGAMNGVALIVHKYFAKIVRKHSDAVKVNPTVKKTLSAFLCFVFITCTWVFFRADSFANAADMFACLTASEGIRQLYSWSFVALLFLFAEIIYAEINKKRNGGKVIAEYMLLDLTKVTGLVMFFTFLCVTILFAYIGNTAFIYGNF